MVDYALMGFIVNREKTKLAVNFAPSVNLNFTIFVPSGAILVSLEISLFLKMVLFSVVKRADRNLKLTVKS